MSTISIQELYQLYVGTLEWCSPAVRNLPDEHMLSHLFEEFDVEARSFLHEVNLAKLQEAGFIDNESVEASKEIRNRWLALESREWTPQQIRCDSEWDELFTLCDSLRVKVTSRNTP